MVYHIPVINVYINFPVRDIHIYFVPPMLCFSSTHTGLLAIYIFIDYTLLCECLTDSNR